MTRQVVWSECPEPNPVEAQDISEWLIEEPARPGQDWVARVIGHIYSDELREIRGASVVPEAEEDGYTRSWDGCNRDYRDESGRLISSTLLWCGDPDWTITGSK